MDHVADRLEAGASGFWLKDSPPDELIAAVRIVARGDALIAPSITRRLIVEFTAHATRAATRPLPPISVREREVLTGVARGLSNLLTKLGCRDRVQLVIRAYEAGVVVAGTT